MNRSLPRLAALTVAVSFACLLLAGCHVTENDQGGTQHVSIGTPFGSMKVDTGNSTNTASIGISPYPGAVPVADKGDDGNNANVHMSFGSFHLGVQAADFQTSDSEDKVLAFYRKDLASHYGAPIECRAKNPVGDLKRTSQGLTCDDDNDMHTATSANHAGDSKGKGIAILSGDSSADTELRAGSPQHLHVVGVESQDGGTRISLVAVDLPSHHAGHAGAGSE